MKRLLHAIALVTFLSGCEKGDPKSPYDVTISQGQSALRFADEVAAVRARTEAREKGVTEFATNLPKSAEKIGPEADPKLVRDIVQAAERAGDDGAYAAEMRRLDEVRAFLDAEQPEIVKKVGGAAAYAAKQGGCSVDVASPVAGALKNAVDDRARERLRAHNDALLLIDRNRDQLGKKNVPALETIADDVAAANYVVSRELPAERDRLARLSSAARGAQSALDRLVSDERKILDDAKSSEDAKRSSRDWIAAAEKEKKRLETAQKDLDERLKTHAERTKAARKTYDDAMSAFRDALAAKDKDKGKAKK
jgi:hypothetical protein